MAAKKAKRSIDDNPDMNRLRRRTETRILPIYSGYVICGSDGKVFDATMHGSRGAAWNVGCEQTGFNIPQLRRLGWRVVKGKFGQEVK